MTGEPRTESEDLEALRRRLEEREREHAESVRRANDAVAAAQDRSYWLERWQIDLNELMRRRGASEARAAVRALRTGYRVLYKFRYWMRDEASALPLRVHDVRRAVQEERRLAQVDESDPFARTISSDPPSATPATDVLRGRLDGTGPAAVEARLTPTEQELWDTAPPAERRGLALSFGMRHEVPEVLEATGLGSVTPAEIQAHSADLVVEALEETGSSPGPGLAGLDFGCSSGQVVRVLGAAYPDMEWHGCDPQAEAIDWAEANLPRIRFKRSSDHPPLPYEDRSLDLVFATSIWTDAGEDVAIAWLAEMERVIRPGGRLVLTTHGPQSIAHAAANGLRPTAQLEEIEHALYRHGFWCDTEGATAFFTPEWLLRRAGGAWLVSAYHPGRVLDDHDLYVLEPR